MKIIQVSSGEVRIPAKYGGGVEARILEMSQHFAKIGHDVVILDRKYSPVEPSIEFLDGIQIIRLSVKLFDFRYLSRMPLLAKFALLIEHILNQNAFAFAVGRFLRHSDCQVIHVHNAVCGLTLASVFKGLRCRLLFSSHTARRSIGVPRILDKIALLWENQVVRLVPIITVNSSSVKANLVNDTKIRRDKVVVIAEGIDTKLYSPSMNKEETKMKLGVGGRSIILFVGRITPIKGVHHLVKTAFRVVSDKKCKLALFVLCGPLLEFGNAVHENAYLSDILKYVKEHKLNDNVIFTGPVPLERLMEWYAVADIFALPSEFETSPSAIREAMAFGKPVVASEVGDIPSYVKANETGFLSWPSDEKLVASQIIYLLSHPSEMQRMGSNARLLMERKFDWAPIIEEMLSVYQKY